MAEATEGRKWTQQARIITLRLVTLPTSSSQVTSLLLDSNRDGGDDLSLDLIWSCDQTTGKASSRVVIFFKLSAMRPTDLIKCCRMRHFYVFAHEKIFDAYCGVKNSSCRQNTWYQHTTQSSTLLVDRSLHLYMGLKDRNHISYGC
jgi:hypothetical protein